MKKAALIHQFDQLEASRIGLVNELDQLDNSILHYKPHPEKWSITEILFHINIAEKISAAYVSKKMLGGESVKKTGLSAAIRSAILSLVLVSGYKWKAPPVLGTIPEGLKYRDVVITWKADREKLRGLLESIPENVLEREIYRHPRGGRMNAVHMFRFFKDHFDHHLKQIRRLEKTSPL